MELAEASPAELGASPAELVALGEALRAQAAFVARAARPVVSSGTAAQAAFVAALREEEAH